MYWRSTCDSVASMFVVDASIAGVAQSGGLTGECVMFQFRQNVNSCSNDVLR